MAQKEAGPSAFVNHTSGIEKYSLPENGVLLRDSTIPFDARLQKKNSEKDTAEFKHKTAKKLIYKGFTVP